jgi:hypothetical protein
MLSPAIVRLTCRRARTSGAIPENSANFCARLVRMTRDLYLRTAAFYLRSGNDSLENWLLGDDTQTISTTWAHEYHASAEKQTTEQVRFYVVDRIT